MSKRSNILIAGGILLIGLFVGGFLVFNSKIGLADFSKQLASLVYKDTKNQDPKSIDSDNDGLPDYLEEIYHANPNNPDTDNDGYLDGEEVMSGYDPLKAGPDDKISDKAIVPRPKPGSFVGVNLTEELAKSIVENMKNSSLDSFIDIGSGSADDIAAGLEPQVGIIVDNALAGALAKSPNLNFIPTFQDSDIKISNETTATAAENYFKQVADIISRNLQKEGATGSSVDALNKAITTNDFSDLDKFIRADRQSFLEIKELTAPQNAKEDHKKFLALLLGSVNIFEASKFIDTDPLKTTIALQQYPKIIDGFKQMYDEGIAQIEAGMGSK